MADETGCVDGGRFCREFVTVGAKTWKLEPVAAAVQEIERWRRRLLIVTDGEIFQDGKKVGELGRRRSRGSAT